jgi:hypothetical protein
MLVSISSGRSRGRDMLWQKNRTGRDPPLPDHLSIHCRKSTLIGSA